jgi:hypothetical protein
MRCLRHRNHACAETSARGSRGDRRKRGFVAVVAVSAWALLATAGAQASTITVGSVLPTTFTPTEFTKVKTLFNTALPEAGANLVSPVNGAIVRWRVQGAKGGPFFLRVLRPNGKGAFEAVGTSPPATPLSEGVQTFATNLRIRSGDMIGIDSTNPTDSIGVAPAPGASFAAIVPPPFEGATVPPSESLAGQEIELSAEVQPEPFVARVYPHSGSIAGGTKVAITGSGFNGASAVKFGELAATTYSVESDTEITATVPASTKVGGVEVTVTTLAGTSPLHAGARPGSNFNYEGCVVPKLRGKTLKQAKRAIRNADCKLGKVKGDKKSKVAEVTRQGPKAGKVMVPGSKVSVTLVKKEQAERK